MAAQPRYLQIKQALLADIESGQLSAGTRVASENELCTSFGVSRMTARRALDELADEGVLVRSQGLGTFVSDERPSSNLVEIRNIADEILARGHQHSCRVLQLHAVAASHRQAVWLAVEDNSQIFHSSLLHFENDRPIQLEQRWINPQFAPDYLGQSFSRSDNTPSAYLTRMAPLTEADHLIEAVAASDEIKTLLLLERGEPCLKVSRRTYTTQGVVSYAQLFHPGKSFRLGGHFRY